MTVGHVGQQNTLTGIKEIRMDTHFSETFKVFKEVIPFAVENQKTFKATCGKRFSTPQFSKSPTCDKCLQIIQENFRLGEEARKILESFQK